MNSFTSFFKLVCIFQEIFYHIWQSLVSNKLNSNNFLTFIFLKKIQRSSLIPSFFVFFKKDFSFNLNNEVINDSNRKMAERSTLLTKEELFILSGFIKVINPQNVFEFGLMRGGSLKLLLNNTSESCMINSIDITHNNLNNDNKKIIENNSRVNAVCADSTKFNFSQFFGSIDFIFIDGGHDYEIVKADSENALKMLRNDGLIIWDDYNPEFPGVFKVVNELKLKGINIIHIADTSFAISTNRDLTEYVLYEKY